MSPTCTGERRLRGRPQPGTVRVAVALFACWLPARRRRPGGQSAQSRARPPCSAAMTLVMAAVRVVLRWSTCPMVPTFTRSLPMVLSLLRAGPARKNKSPLRLAPEGALFR